MPPPPPDSSAPDRLQLLEARLARIEAHLGLSAAPSVQPVPVDIPDPTLASAPTEVSASPAATQREADELELAVGQNWFALVGILVLVLGGGFMLTLPFARLPALMPSAIGMVVAAAIFFVARTWERSFELVSGHLRGAGMALLFLATLRLFFFGSKPALSIDSLFGPSLLAVAVAVNVVIALRRNSPWLTGLALASGGAAILAVGSATWLAIGLVALATLAGFVSHQRKWPAIALAGIGVVLVTYALWAVGNQVRGGDFHFVAGPVLAPASLLLIAGSLGALPLLRPAEETEDTFTIFNSIAVSVLGYGIFLVHTAATYPATFARFHLAASFLYLGLAAAFWNRRQSHVSTFFFAMTGYAGLSMAIIKLAPSPDVFVWLSLQSVMVVTTAIWFRSRSIVVANFLIYVGIVLAYVVVKTSETGISVGFGIVALVSARILNWQKHRLALKTELMRNAYLFSGFIVFPYALYHLVPAKAAGLAWIGMATVYYVLNFVVRNQKYRWMGHGTLLLTSVYLVVAGGKQMEPVWRVASFLVLGIALLVVSLTFTRLRRRELAAHAG